ncbi:metallophosphoesterase family protein [Marinimicrococcus flavescens]|uniref:Metallophosphoesterase family protein n=1 Tax=Marinimicrococcus flavescens TaxID=3031815 RepID=A0AAP3UY76_9PROT|nr:metallophosphoesterase family protein [Marinimicrococcus flavescens]
MRVFFTSDTHFGHGGALGLFKRPFASVAAMDEALVCRWNAVVRPEDEVWHLGDFALRRTPAAMEALLARLAGRKHLVAGNNDGPATLALEGWASVQAYAEIELQERSVVLCHYPFRSWNGMRRGALNLHGHTHGRLAPLLPRQIDVGVDVRDFRPVTLDELLEALAARRRRRAPRT